MLTRCRKDGRDHAYNGRGRARSGNSEDKSQGSERVFIVSYIGRSWRIGVWPHIGPQDLDTEYINTTKNQPMENTSRAVGYNNTRSNADSNFFGRRAQGEKLDCGNVGLAVIRQTEDFGR